MYGARRFATAVAIAGLAASGCALIPSHADAQHRAAARAARTTAVTGTDRLVAPDQLALSPTRLRGLSRWQIGSRNFLMYVPRRVSRPADVMVALGGLYWSARDTWRNMRLDKVADKSGAVVVYPEPINGEWNAIGCCDHAKANDVGFLAQVRRKVAQLIQTDPRHEELIGFSVGGMLAYIAACTDPGWSSIIVVGATLTARCTPGHPFAITDVNGTKDTVVPWNGGWSGYTRRTLPAVWKIDMEFATSFRCGAARRTTAKRTLWTTYAGCIGAVSIRDVQVPGLGHHWATHEKDGWDMGPALWKLSPP